MKKKETGARRALLGIGGAACAALVGGAEARAAGGMGNVWATNVAEDSLRVSWNLGSKFSPSGDNPFRICWKPAGGLTEICKTHQARTGLWEFQIDGLEPDDPYKVKVECHCTKKGKRAAWRKVATMKTRTAPENLAGGYVQAEPVDSNTIKVAMFHSNPGEFDSFGVCYKIKGTPNPIESWCKDRRTPDDQGAAAGCRHYIDLSTRKTVLLDGLRSDRYYKIAFCGVSSTPGKTKILSKTEQKVPKW